MKELALQNTRLDNRYDVLRLLGRGSYAEIFLARDNQAARDSAHQLIVIKALNVFLQEAPDTDLERTLIENFQNEAIALDKVRHPNVINRLGHGTARDLRGSVFHYLVLEYLSGGNLSEMCRLEALDFEQTLFYLEQVANGLQHAHEQGVIHRDIKPQNLLLTENRRTVKIADFGVARFAEHDSPITRVGTNVYAAPEHSPANNNSPSLLNVEKLTPAADVYSLAKTVYSVMFCESPRRFANSPITDLPEKYRDKPWSADVLRILKKATQTDPASRFQSVREFWREFAEIKNRLHSSRHPANVSASKQADFVPQAPASPSFSSLKAVQRAVAEEASSPISPKPKIVVELNRTEQNRQTATQRQNEPILADQSDRNSNFVPVFGEQPNNLPSNGKAADVRFQEISHPTDDYKMKRPAGFFKKLIIGVMLISVFSGVLYGTFSYLQNRGLLPASVNIFKTPRGVTNKDAWLRSTPGGGNNQLGIVNGGSELKIYNKSSDGNWFEVEVVRQNRPENSNLATTRGWIHRSIVDLEQ